jgi:hypothetical protein
MIGSLITPFNTFSGLLSFGNPSQLDYDNDGSLPITMYIDQSKIYGARNSSSQIVTISNGVPFLYVLQYDGAFINSWLNGTQQTDPSINISKTGTFTYTNYSVANRSGTTGSIPWSGYFGEILVYQSPVSTTDRQRVEGYLAWKWGLNTSLIVSQPFKSLRPSARYFNPFDIGECLFWFDAADKRTITLTGSSVTQWINKGAWVGNATTYSGSVTSGETFNGLNIIHFDPFCRLAFSAPIPNQARAWFAVFRQTTQVSRQGTGDTQYFACVNQIDGNGQDSFSGPSLPFDIATDSYNISEGPSGIAAWVVTDTAPNGYNIMKQYCIVNSEASSAGNFITVNGTAQTLSTSEYARAYRTVSSQYVIGDAYGNGMDLAEIIFYNIEITVAQRQQVEGYLTQKWGIAASLPVTHPFSKFPPSSALPFAPPNFSQCTLWLDGADPAGTGIQPVNGASVSTWVDKSGSTNNMTTYIGSPVFNKNPTTSISFNGSSSLVNTSFTSQIFTLFFVYRQTSSTGPLYTTSALQDVTGLFPNESGTTYFDRGGSWYTQTSAFPLNTTNILTIQYTAGGSGATMFLWFNGTLNMSEGTVGNRIVTALLLGIRPYTSTYITGNYYEVIQYTKVISDFERQKVEGYLAWKWGLENSLPSTHPYKLLQPAQESFTLITPGAIATVTLSGLSGSGGTINWDQSTNAVGYNWYVGTGPGSGQVATGSVSGGATLTASVTYAFVIATNYYAWVIPYSSTGTNGPTTISAAASYSASVLITTVGAGSVSFGAGSQIVIECWGGGGGSMGQDQSTGAGAGGAYAKTTILQASAFTLYYSVGGGGIGSSGSATSGEQTWANVSYSSPPFNTTEGALADGGAGSGFTGPNNSNQFANSIGDIIYIGGYGGYFGPENGGGGSASSADNGNPGDSGNGANGGGAGSGGGSGGAGGGFGNSGEDGISNVEGGGGGGGAYNYQGGMGGIPGGAGGMGWSVGGSPIQGVNTNPHGYGGDGGRGQIRYSRT